MSERKTNNQSPLRRMSVTQKLLWMKKNRGALADVARQLDKTMASVSAVFWGKGTSAEIEQAINDRIESENAA